MPSRRQKQVAELLHQEISQLIQYRTQDPRLGFVTVTGVDVSPDLREARVYVTVLGDDVDARSTLEGLTSAARYFRHELGQSLSLRYVPNLTFMLDTSLEYGLHIDNLLDSIKEDFEQQDETENLSETNSVD
jgi:ribosome-binding factor A